MESLVLLQHFSLVHCLTKRALKDLLRLVALFLPTSAKDILPSSVYMMKRAFVDVPLTFREGRLPTVRLATLYLVTRGSAEKVMFRGDQRVRIPVSGSAVEVETGRWVQEALLFVVYVHAYPKCSQ